MSAASPADELAGGLRALIGAGAPGRREITVDGLRQTGGGASREAWSFDARWAENGDRVSKPCFLLRNPPRGLLDSDPGWEFDVITVVHRSGIPTPQPLWVDRDGSLLGRPGFVTERIPGTADRRRLLGDGREADQAKADEQLVSVLARLHAIDVNAIGPPFGAPPAAREVAGQQLAHWVGIIDDAGLEPNPGIAEAAAWMARHLPVAPRLSVVHGDYRYGNMLFDGARLSGVLDWEMCHIGDPAEDVVWPFRPFRRGTEPFQGWPAYLARYQTLTGDDIGRDRLVFYRMLAELKTMAIYLTGAAAVADAGNPDVQLANAAFGIDYATRQLLAWIDEVEGVAPCTS